MRIEDVPDLLQDDRFLWNRWKVDPEDFTLFRTVVFFLHNFVEIGESNKW